MATGQNIFGMNLFRAFALQICTGGKVLQVKLQSSDQLLSVADKPFSPTACPKAPDPELQQTIREYADLFNGFGRAKFFEHESKLVDGFSPVVQKARPIPLAYESAVNDEIKRLLDDGIIESVVHPTSDDWVTPVVITPKSDGSVKIALDMRIPNKSVIKDHYPLPNVKTLMARIASAKYISKVDLKYAH